MSACPEGSFKKIPCAAVDGNRFKNEIADAMRGDGNGDAPATVFLDEIDELDQNCQRTLLSALMHAENSDEDSENTPRLICAASRDLEEEVARGRFGESSSSGSMAYACDCRHCGSVRGHPGVARLFSGEHAGQLRKPVPSLTDDVLELLQGYHWPGNIRELENLAKENRGVRPSEDSFGGLENGTAEDGENNGDCIQPIAANCFASGLSPHRARTDTQSS